MNRKKMALFLVPLLVFCCLIGCGEQKKNDKAASGTAVVPEETAYVSEGQGESASGESMAGESMAGESVEGVGGAIDGDEENSSELHRLSCQFAKQIVAGLMGPVIETMTPELAAQITEEQLQKSWDGEAGGLTGYQGIETVVETVGQENEKVSVSVRYANNTGMKINFTFNNENFIEALWFERITLPSLQSSTGQADDIGEKTTGEKTNQTSYDYEEAEFVVGRKPYELKGALTVPKTGGKVPVVILFSEKDSLDMDGTIGQAGNTPMRDIAYGLANKGIASLRYNRRGYQYASSLPANAGTYDLFLQDALYAVDQIYNDRRIDRKRIYLLGHGWAADYLPAVLQKKEKRIAGAIMLAGKPVAAAEVYYAQKEKNIRFDAKYLMDKNSTMPLFILQGEADFETGMNDYKQWRTVLKGRAHTEYRLFKKLNHHFMITSGKKDAADYDVEGKVNTSVMNEIARFCNSSK